jgi:glutamate formiminotransferase / 5-formyltetrahydrofolate cyclo-ligase
VKGMGSLTQGRAQISMNIADFESTPVSQVFNAVSKLSQRHKTAPVSGEIVGLIPRAAFERDSEWVRQLVGFDPAAKILEQRLAAPLAWPVER